jgi:archaellum component FlaC
MSNISSTEFQRALTIIHGARKRIINLNWTLARVSSENCVLRSQNERALERIRELEEQLRNSEQESDRLRSAIAIGILDSGRQTGVSGFL